MKAEVKVYLKLVESCPDVRHEIESAFANTYPELFDGSRTLSKRLDFLEPWREALRKEAVIDLERKQRNNVLFGWEKEKLEQIEEAVGAKRLEILERHPEGFIK